jgi:arylsulfatase A-like enzyme
VGELISALKSEWRYRKALIVFTADHGESFTERELWFDHGTAASAEQLHVPLIVKYPGNKGDGERVGAQVGLADIAPTVLQLVEEGLSEEGVAVPEAWAALRKGMDGRSLRGTERRPLLGGESSHCKTEPALRCDPPGPMGKELAARDGEHAVVQAVTRDGVELRVYDRKADPAELKPLSAPAPAELASRVAEMQQLRAAMGLSAPEASADPNDEESQKLKELGYMD